MSKSLAKISAVSAMLVTILWQSLSTTNLAIQATPTDAAYGWQQVAIGGGGYVTGIYLHPQEANLVYIRTDNGGFFRWLSAQERWLPLTDHFPPEANNYYGGEALALDPQNPDVVYIAAGKYVGELGRIFKSTNRGATWVESNLELPMGGDEAKRWTGNRLAVSPFNSNLLLFGSRQDGLWRSLDGGINWTQVHSLVAQPDPEIGILAIAFDPNLPNRVYLGAYGEGIYLSEDSGTRWRKLEGSPSQAMKLKVAQDSTLYVTSATYPGVSKYVRGVWQDITPIGEHNQIFNGLSTHPSNEQELLVSWGETGDTTIYHSQNGGITWKELLTKVDNTVPWWSDSFFRDHTSALEFDPHVPHRVWLTDWLGIWRTENINADLTIWRNYQQGHEQTVPFTLVAPPRGALLMSGIADVDGFYHQSLDHYPQQRLSDFQDTYSIAYCAGQPNFLVRVGGRSWNDTYTGATSTDGGLTWQPFAHFPDHTIPLRVALSATNPDNFVIIVNRGQALQSSDGGNSWQLVSGLPSNFDNIWNWSQPLSADGVKGERFYYYAGGTIYRSDDGGLSFQAINRGLPKQDKYLLQTIPGFEGQVWLSLGAQGLYHSHDAGETFTKVTGVHNALLFSFGKPPPGSNIPTLYLYGQVNDQAQDIFWSLDWGKTWHRVDAELNTIGTQLHILEASKQQFGLVFVGTNGRGIYHYHVAQKS